MFAENLKQLRKSKNLTQILLGEKLNVDIYLAAIVVFVGRMFTNLAIIRRHYIDKWTSKDKNNN